MPITGLRPDSFKNMQLNAGMFLMNFDHSTFEDADALLTGILAAIGAGTGVLGATLGGGTFQTTPTIRQIEVDGMRAPFVGSTQNDMWTVKLTTTLKEITPENFELALSCTEKTTSGKKTTLKIKNDISNEDYIPKLCWVGDTNDHGFIMIELSNALNLTGANFTFVDKGEGTLPVEFQAHQGDMVSNKFAPCEIIFFDKPATP